MRFMCIPDSLQAVKILMCTVQKHTFDLPLCLAFTFYPRQSHPQWICTLADPTCCNSMCSVLERRVCSHSEHCKRTAMWHVAACATENQSICGIIPFRLVVRHMHL